MSSDRQIGPAGALGLWAAVAFAGALYGTWLGYGGRGFAITLGVFAFFLAAEILVAARGVRERLAGLFDSRRGLSPALALLPIPLLAYLVYALGTNSFLWWRVEIATAFVVLPSLLAASARQRPFGAWQDYAALVLIWLPVKFRVLQPLWPYPDGRLGYALTVLLALTVAMVAFLFVRGLDGVGYTIAWGRGVTSAVVVNFVLLAVILILLGEWIGFIRFEPSYAQLNSLPLVALSIFFFTAWTEEFLFRGLLQNLLCRTLRSSTIGWLAASVIFGFAHITNGTFPNWRYVLLAAIAGVFYGRAWRQTGSMFASALVHMLVDVTWHFFFRTL